MTEKNFRTPEEIDAEIEKLKALKKNTSVRGALNEMPSVSAVVQGYKDRVTIAKRGFLNNANSYLNRIENYKRKIQELEALERADLFIVETHPEIQAQINQIIRDGMEQDLKEYTIQDQINDVLNSNFNDYEERLRIAQDIKEERENWMAELKAPRRKKKQENQEDNHPLEMETD